MNINSNQYINIHTHNKSNKNVLALKNIFAQDIETELTIEKQAVSIGLHPCHIKSTDIEQAIKLIEQFASAKHVIAIGEIGLDRCIDTPFDIQVEVFQKQIEIAKKFGKRVIIHCVKAYSDILAIKKKIDLTGCWIIHGFNANIQVAEQLIGKNCYLSFGEALFNPNSKTTNTFKTIPLEYIFIETDESEKDISEIYNKACEIRSVSLSELKKQISDNFNVCFNQG